MLRDLAFPPRHFPSAHWMRSPTSPVQVVISNIVRFLCCDPKSAVRHCVSPADRGAISIPASRHPNPRASHRAFSAPSVQARKEGLDTPARVSSRLLCRHVHDEQRLSLRQEHWRAVSIGKREPRENSLRRRQARPRVHSIQYSIHRPRCMTGAWPFLFPTPFVVERRLASPLQDVEIETVLSTLNAFAHHASRPLALRLPVPLL